MSGRIGFVSLGCPKALVDSERILTELRTAGYELVPSYEDADVVVVNTCGFITPAVEESLDAIGEALDRTGRVVVTGCLGEKPDTIRDRHPHVSAVTGEGDVDGVMRAVGELLPPEDHPFVRLAPPPRGVKLTPRHYSYLKIAEGCDHTCAFCIIPQMRGLQRSRDAADVLAEATRLVATGTRELVVIAQDTSAYGTDLRHRESRFAGRDVPARLGPLVRELAALDVWLRLHYVYPYPHVRELIPLMAEGALLPYLDVPLQHASPRVLRAMRRPGGAESHLGTIRAWRSVRPDLAIRSTFIAGFPGETEDDVELLIDFLREARLDRVGVFAYSEVDGATANALPGAVPAELRRERRDRVMAAQQEISASLQAAKVGRELDVIVDAYGELPGEIVGRSVYDAPDVDGVVTAVGDGTTKIGDRVVVRIDDASAYDLRGTVLRAKPWTPGVPAWS